jgi:hypothetical protein
LFEARHGVVCQVPQVFPAGIVVEPRAQDGRRRRRAQPPFGQFSDFIIVLYLYATVSTTGMSC